MAAVRNWMRVLCASLLDDLDHGHPGGGFVDDGLVLGEGGDESLEG